MRFSGEMFRNAMLYNFVTVKNKVVQIHNTNNENYGFISMYNTDSEEEINFTLALKDYQTLSMLGKFELKVAENKINIKTSSGKITFANILDINIPQPDIDNAESINIKPSEFMVGKSFVGNDPAKPQYAGCNVTPSGYFITDSFHFFIRYKKTEVKETVCIPKETFRYIDDVNQCATDGKIIVFAKESQLFYSSLVATAADIPKISMTEIVSIKVSRSELVDNLKMLKSYADRVQLKFDKKLKLLAVSETNNFELGIESILEKGNKLLATVSISKALKIVEVFKEDKIVLMFDKKMIFIKNEDTIAATSFMQQQEKVEVE